MFYTETSCFIEKSMSYSDMFIFLYFIQVSLSLAEKQRIQKEQEFQERMKKQKPIHAEQSNSIKPKISSTDLTHTLMDTAPPSLTTGLGSISSTQSTIPPSMSTCLASMPSTQSTLNSTTGMSYGVNTSGMMSSQSSFGGTSAMYGAGGSAGISSKPQATMGNQPTAKPTTDTSAFDSLLGSQFSKPKPSLNQISSGGQRSGQPGIMGMQQGVMGQNPAPMQQGVMGQSPAPMGMQQGSMGMYQSNMGMGTQGMMGNQSMMGTQRMMGTQSMMGSQGMMGNWQAPANQMGGGSASNQLSGVFDPLAPVSATAPQKKSDSLLDF